jgi:hypothetical protein
MLTELDYLKMIAHAVAVGKKSIELAKSKNRFNPFTTPLMEGDRVDLDITDKNGDLVSVTDERGGTFILAHLVRKGRKAAYSFYPSMLTRYWQLVIDGVGKSESEPVYVQNEGIPVLMTNETIEEFVCANYVGASITIKKIKRPLVWKFRKNAYKPGKEYTDNDFEAKKGNVYTFAIVENAIAADALEKLSKSAEELFDAATAPQIS